LATSKWPNKRRDISEISSLNKSFAACEHSTIMKRKNLKKKIRRLEKRLQEGPKKLAKLKRKLEAAEAAKAMKASKKSAGRARAKQPATVKKAKKKLNLSPERRAQLSAAMKARWAAKRATEANAKAGSSDNQHSAAGPTPQAPESRPDGA
jgi:predicted RNase H-like nuclease (RuvC/YqgF family)